jgi:hypothetical protein
MKWYKHHSDFRQSPAMKYVAEQLGDQGVAGVYRLWEVFAQRFGANDDFSGSITLSPPFTDRWLAQEILMPRFSEDEVQEAYRDLNEVPIEQLNKFLQVCAQAGLIEIAIFKSKASVRKDDGSKEDVGESTFRKLTIPGFEDLQDDWSARRGSRKKSAALSTPE